MHFQHLCNTYLRELQETRDNTAATDELSLHRHLTAFLEQSAACFGQTTVTLTHEPRQLEVGRPDFIAMDGLLPIGYIEAEKFGTDLDALTGHAREQNARFIENLDNFILTNFVEFRLYTEGQLRASASLSIENGRTRLPEETHALETLLNRFFGAGALNITTPEVLAMHLARRTRELQIQIATAVADEENTLFRMFETFQEHLLATLTPADFADMYAQTLAYGMFAARYTLPNATNFSRSTAADAMPNSNPFLIELFQQITSRRLQNNNVTWMLDEIATLLRSVSTDMLRTAFDARTHAEDPVIHFYETFLAAYDARRRVDRGVYYTPQPIIAYIVRSVDALLKKALNKRDGLADTDTLILDPATGTGGFLMEVLNHIRQHVIETDGSAAWSPYVNTSLVERLFGFELLVAPYTIAHLNLSRFLQAHGWTAMDTERIHVYLTNTLEEAVEREGHIFEEFLTDEANAAVSVKRDLPILVIVGNPPYPENSANPSRNSERELTFIGGLIEDYKLVDSKPLGERSTKALQADSIKFIRWAQWRIDENGEGVIGYVVNNNFLDGLVFRGMRQSLMNSFNAIYHLNLHGSGRRREAVPEGQSNENVFNILQGVSLLLCVKERDNAAPAKVYYADMWGSRTEKYHSLLGSDVQHTEWTELQPTSPLYLFVPQATEHEKEYKGGWALTDIFQTYATGIVTGRDKLTLHRSPESVHQTVTDFGSCTEEEARRNYQLPKDSTQWKVRAAQADIAAHPEIEKHIVSFHYRPFDSRWTYYTGKKGFHRNPCYDIMRHLLAGENVALCTCRIVTSHVWQHVWVTDRLSDKSCISNKSSGSCFVFPLYLYPAPDEFELASERSLNFKPAFLDALSEKLGVAQHEELGTPEDILAYIYAVLHSPTYRERYIAFLKYDFPRIPLPTDMAQFQKLVGFGHTLIDAHLGRREGRPFEIRRSQTTEIDAHLGRHELPAAPSRFEGEGDSVVARVQYRDGHVWINPTQYFSDVPLEVWEFEIGSYQVCEKWLRDRRGEALTHAAIRQYRQVLAAVAETLRVMQAIDEG